MCRRDHIESSNTWFMGEVRLICDLAGSDKSCFVV